MIDEEQLRSRVRGLPPLRGRLEPWMATLLADPARCAALVEQFGSPLNVIDPRPLERNATELTAAGEASAVSVRLRFARKANKTLALVQTAADAGHGVDVAGFEELRQVLELGVEPARIILSTAVKPRRLLELAIRRKVTISLDTVEELQTVAQLALQWDTTARVAPRVAPSPAAGLSPTRFGELAAAWRTVLCGGPVAGVEVVGLHVHLNGYAVADRVAAAAECLELNDLLGEAGHRPTFLDIGGGVPVNYLLDQAEWDAFWARAAKPANEELTWKNRVLQSTYPFFQAPTRSDWLKNLLDATLPDGRRMSAALTDRGLDLQLEPGRALADGCGLTLARVAFVKHRSDGVPLVGLEMNRTQCRSTSEDFLVDPILISHRAPTEPSSGFLVGAYCIEDELILLRRFDFPLGVAPGDLIALINTGGYLMHILESASHQLPLAKNVVRTDDGFVLDGIDADAGG